MRVVNNCFGATLVVGLVSACSGGESNGPPAFPANYAATYTEVRNCRGPSIAHQNENIRVMASPDALDPYMGRVDPFPIGAIVLKEQYAASDQDCSGSILEYSVMVRLATGSAPDTLDWTWQHVSASREVLNDDIKTCTSCHSNCDGEGGGYLGTCEDP